MNYLPIVFEEIETLYRDNRLLLLETDEYRPCKSITRDIFATFDKFVSYYKANKTLDITYDQIMTDVCGSTAPNDTVNTNIRVMREFEFLIQTGPTSFSFTFSFLKFLDSGISGEQFVLNGLKNCKSITDFNMVYNTMICALREGYLNEKIIDFPDSEEKFRLKVPDLNKRIEYRQMVFDIYGFHGRNKSITADDYTPNANYRILTVLKALNLIEANTTPTDNMQTFHLTEDGIKVLKEFDRRCEHFMEKTGTFRGTTKAKGGFNKIFYGAPGCGKSYFVRHDILENSGVLEENSFRTTFHPDFSNSDFIGQIMPKVDGDKVTYEFIPGPFALALRRACETDKMVYLVIEEINRGNASAIFGDLFQLLDRVKDSSNPNFGESEYSITNVNLQNYLSKEFGVSFNQILLPSNLTILATMNSSDQNVFTLDTAFKRRWAFEQISNDIDADTTHPYKDWFIPGTNISWAKFLKKINEKILEFKISNSSSEDKRLGKYFVTKDCLTETAKVIGDCEMEANNFAYKVLEYLWNDVCKLNPEEMFDLSKYQTLEDLIEGFKREQTLVFQNIDFNA